jgi:hypothetical protein
MSAVSVASLGSSLNQIGTTQNVILKSQTASSTVGALQTSVVARNRFWRRKIGPGVVLPQLRDKTSMGRSPVSNFVPENRSSVFFRVIVSIVVIVGFLVTSFVVIGIVVGVNVACAFDNDVFIELVFVVVEETFFFDHFALVFDVTGVVVTTGVF